tara:strand:- start:353 stop:646 length:294 start_codon:yes stop_codon:yes gene_type:complete
MKGQAMRAVTKTFDLYAVLHGDDIVSQWYPTQDQALFEAYSLGLVRRNKQTDQPYFPVDVRVVSFETLREFENARCVDTGMRWLKDNSHGTIARNKG